MFRETLDFVRSAFLLAHDVQENMQKLENLRKEFERMEEKLHQIALLIERERGEREKMALQLENALLRFERQLPPPSAEDR